MGHFNPGVAQDKQGNVYLFWDQNPGIYYVVTNTNNIACNTGCTPIQYSTNANNYDIHPVPVTLSNGTLLMLFASKRGGTNNFGIYAARLNAGSWSSPGKVTSGVANDQNPSAFQDTTGKVWASWQRTEIGDLKIKYFDTDNNGVWDPGEAIIYDSNNDGKYSSGRFYNDTLIYGGPPANNTALSIDPRIGFIDSFGYGVWNPGDFVVYDSNTNNTYDPHLMYVDSSGDNVWNYGEAIVYKTNTTFPGFSGTGTCRGTAIPTNDCVIIGTVPSSSAVLKIDPHLKFVDLNGDGIWEPGETLVYDANNGVNGNSGKYAANDIAIVPLTGDTKLRFIGTGTAWASSSTLIYNSNGSTEYDGGIMFVDDNSTNHWVTGDTVVYHKGTVDLYDDTKDILIAGTTDDLGRQLKNDPGLRFVDTNGDGIWEPGEPVVYDTNHNGGYDARLMFARTGTNTTWVPGETVVYDSNGDGKYTTGRYYNDTIIAGIRLANNTSLSIDPKLKFYDTDGNMVWELGESVIYDTNNNSLYDSGDQIIYGAAPPSGVGLATGLGEPVIASAPPPVGSPLTNDAKLRYVKSGTNTTWVPGETVVYDKDGNGFYGYGKYDSNIRFVNSTTSPMETWASGKAVVYDVDGDGRYIFGKYVSVNDTIICGPLAGCTGTVANNTALKIDTRLDFVDCTSITCDTNNRWEQGEAVFYDSNGNGVYDPGETIIVGTPPTAKPVIRGSTPTPGTSLSTDPLLRYPDSNGNGMWDSSEAVVYDALNKGSFQASYYPADLVRGIIPLPGTNLAYNIGEPWISGPPPTPGTLLNVNIDSRIKIVDLNANGHWDQKNVLNTQYSAGEPVVYDTNNNGVYDTGIDLSISGSPTPSIGTPLKIDETTLAGITAAAGTHLNTYDPKMKFVASGTNTTWVPGESVIYDVANTCTVPANCRYVAGKYFNDTIIAGTPPLNNTGLGTDTKLKYSIMKDRVFYDSNNDSIYESGEPIVAILQIPPTSTLLASDSNIKYFDSDGNLVWDPGESVVYTSGSTYAAGNIVLSGPVPEIGSPLSSDAKIRYVNDLGTTTWSQGETVVYNTAGTGVYNSNEPIITSGNPVAGSPLVAATHIFYKTYSAGSWSQEQRLTTLPKNDNSPSITQAEDGRTWVAWDGDRGGGSIHQIITRTSIDGVNWTPETNITTITNLGDRHPVIAQDRNGTIWLVWSQLLSCGTTCLNSDLWMTSSTNNGATWASETALTSTTSQSESNPYMVQLSDKNLYIFYTAPQGCLPNCTALPIFYFAAQISPIHSARMNNFTTNATISVSLGRNIRSGQFIHLTANVSNTGDGADTFMLSAKFNSTNVPITNSSMVPVGQSKVLSINWLVSGLRPGRYVFSANVTDLTAKESYANLVDNVQSYTIIVRPAGDVNGDCVVDIADLVLVASNFGKIAGSPGYPWAADLNFDGAINIADLSIVGSTFGQTC